MKIFAIILTKIFAIILTKIFAIIFTSSSDICPCSRDHSHESSDITKIFVHMSLKIFVHVPETTAMNPQFHIQIPRSGAAKCHVVVGLTYFQKCVLAFFLSISWQNTVWIIEELLQCFFSSNCNPLVGECDPAVRDQCEQQQEEENIASHRVCSLWSATQHDQAHSPVCFGACKYHQYVFYVSDNNIVFLQKPLDVTNHSVAREVVTFFTLPPGKCLIIMHMISITFRISGEYIVMPQTNVPNCDGKFLLRILTDEQSNIWWVRWEQV